MTITLRPEHEKLITQAMQTGAYGSPDEVIGRALEVLHFGELRYDDAEAVAEKIERAFDQFERGDFLSGEESRTDMEKRKAGWLAKHR